MEGNTQKVDKALQETAEAQRKADAANRRLVVLPVAFLIAIVVFLILVVGLHVYISPKSAGDKNGLFQASASIFQVLAIIIGGIVAYITLFLTWRENARQALQLSQNRERTERYNQAVNQLGHDSLEIRVGGIYALERIAREYQGYSRSIMDLLTDYIRHHAPWPPRRLEESAGSQPELSSQQQSAVHRFPDVQTVLTVLSRRVGEDIINLRGTSINLRGTDLRRGDLRGGFFEIADLEGVNLQGADLRYTDFKGSRLNFANLEGADLKGADLRDTDLRGANLEGTILEGADLSSANLSDTNSLTEEQIELAHGDVSTFLPKGVHRPPHWMEGAS